MILKTVIEDSDFGRVGVLLLGVCLAQVGWADSLMVCGSIEPTSAYVVRGSAATDRNEDARPIKASISAMITIDFDTEETELVYGSKSVPIIGSHTIYFDSLMLEEGIVSGFNQADLDKGDPDVWFEGDFYSLHLEQEEQDFLQISLADVVLFVMPCLDFAKEMKESPNQDE